MVFQQYKSLAKQFPKNDPWVVLSKEIYGDLDSTYKDLQGQSVTNKQWNPSVSKFHDISEEELIQHYTGQGYSADKKLHDLKVALGIAGATTTVLGPGEDLDIQRKIRDLYYQLFQATEGKVPNPVTGKIERMPAEWQSAAAQAYAREQGNYLSLQGQVYTSAKAPIMVGAEEEAALGREFGSNIYAPFGGAQIRGASLAQAGTQQGTGIMLGPRAAARRLPAFSDAGGQYSTMGTQKGSGGLIGTVASGATSQSGAGTMSAAAAAAGSPTTVNKNLTVNNTFATQPTDPLPWSRSVQLDLELM
jgi:hypothetical protein